MQILAFWRKIMQQTTLSYAESHFSEMCRQVIENQDILLVIQEKSENVVMMPQSLFEAWQRHLLLDEIENLELNALADKRLNDGQALIKVTLDEL
jgi:PHD/YefM family antitoxin component YafN of YafNO toxin-antitoxin module